MDQNPQDPVIVVLSIRKIFIILFLSLSSYLGTVYYAEFNVLLRQEKQLPLKENSQRLQDSITFISVGMLTNKEVYLKCYQYILKENLPNVQIQDYVFYQVEFLIPFISHRLHQRKEIAVFLYLPWNSKTFPNVYLPVNELIVNLSKEYETPIVFIYQTLDLTLDQTPFPFAPTTTEAPTVAGTTTTEAPIAAKTSIEIGNICRGHQAKANEEATKFLKDIATLGN